MSEAKQITLPVVGMTCANCVRAVERNSKKVDGVADATVNYASEKVTVVFDPHVTDTKTATNQVIERVERAGYDIPTASEELSLLGMTCANCANTIERRLNKSGRRAGSHGELCLGKGNRHLCARRRDA